MDPVNAKGINPENHQEKTKNLLLKKNPRNLVKNPVKNPKNIDRTILVRIKNIENLHRNPVTKTKKKNDEKIAAKEMKKTNRKILSECNIVDDRVAKLRVRVGYLTSSTGNPLLLNVGYRVPPGIFRVFPGRKITNNPEKKRNLITFIAFSLNNF